MNDLSPSAVERAAVEGSAETLTLQQTPVFDPGLQLLRTTGGLQNRQRLWISVVSSIAIHLLAIPFALKIRNFVPHVTPRPAVRRVVTRLYIPRDLLTQKAPNRGKLSKTFDLDDLLAAQQAQRRLVAPPPGKLARPRNPGKPDERPREPEQARIAVEPPPKEVAQAQAPTQGVPEAPAVTPQPAPPNPAPLQTPPVGVEEPKSNAAPRIAPPKNSVQDVIRQLARQNTTPGNVMVRDDEGTSRPLPSAPGSQASPPKMGSSIELQSDPQGADFKPYLTRILAVVRRNWFSVLPDSARMGALRGRTTIQFVVNRDGSIPKLVIADSSGLQPLDRAAVAGLSMSNPLPPLPNDFKGASIRLQFSFSYNMPSL